jgi:hypothetical protein
MNKQIVSDTHSLHPVSLSFAVLLSISFLLFHEAVSASAADIAPPKVVAARLPESAVIRIDGRLDESAWQTANPISNFRQREPREGEPATEDTEIRILYNADALFIGVLAHDKEPDQVIGRILQRDKIIVQGFDGEYAFAGDDVIAILLDPFLDRRNAFVFATNPNGAEFDALITDESPSWNIDWRGIWKVAACRNDQGWSAEFEIPFRTLRYPESADSARAWGFNVIRLIRRRNERTLWTGWTRAGGGFHRVSRAGVIKGLSNLPHSGVNIELKPVGLLGASREQGLETELLSHAGLDMKWELSPGLVLDATLHPDFAQVESDDEQVNLTRFDLFYPEKRDFFLENAGIFEFGTRGFFEPPPFLLFMSRSIGIKDEDEIPLLGGLRLSGRTGRQTIGFLDVASNAAAGDPRTNNSVFRYKRDVGGSNFIGLALTDRRNRAGWNMAGGLDGSFWLSPSVNVQAFAAQTETSGPGGDDTAYRAALQYSGDRFGFSADHMVIGPETNVELGFVTRTDIRRTSANGRITFRPGRYGLRRIELFMVGGYVTRLTGEIQDRNLGQFTETELESGEIIDLFLFRGFTRLDEAFDMSDRVTVPVGDYSLRDLGFMFNSSPKRPIILAAMMDNMHFYDGRIQSMQTDLTLAPDQHISIGTRYNYNRVRLPGGRFDSHVASVRFVLALSTRLSFQTLVQYNSLDRKFLVNARVHFIHHPGSDLFLVWNEERGSPSSIWTLGRRDAVVKLTALFRL